MRYQRQLPRQASLTAVPGGLAWQSPYDPGLVNAFKLAVPPDARRWEPSAKHWIIDAQYGLQVARLTEAYLGVVLTVPGVPAVVPTEIRLLRLEYLGQTKDRGGDEPTAFGWLDGSWNLIVPEPVLREWFEALPTRPDEQPTLYAVLAVKATATEQEIRSAYRRMAKQWHPDVCRERDAAEVFKSIQHAFEVLGNEGLRRKYDAGRILEASLRMVTMADTSFYRPPVGGYRAPLRCGWLLCEGQERLGRFVVSKILQWKDVTDGQGRVMISSWPVGADRFEVVWQ